MKNNIAILNFHFENNNYGAILTSYALNKFIRKLGYTVHNIDYIPHFAQISGKLKGPLKEFSNFKNFRNKYIPITKKYTDSKYLIELNDVYNTFIVGSDQVWNPFFCINDLDVYFLNFVNEKNKKISFAASFGSNKINIDSFFINQIGYMLSKFDFISVREKSGVDIVRDIFKQKSYHVIDPVFLLEESEWNKFTNNKKYNLIYYIINSNTESKIKTQLKNFENIRYKNVEEWISAIKNSDFLITDSFHGVCFSLIFRKKFACVINKSQNIEKIKNIFDIFSIPSELLVVDPENYRYDNLKNIKIDYTTVCKKINILKDFSIEFLNIALGTNNEYIYDKYYFYNKIFDAHLETECFVRMIKYNILRLLCKISFGSVKSRFQMRLKKYTFLN